MPLKKPEYQDFITAEENHSVEQQLLDLGSEKLMITDDVQQCLLFGRSLFKTVCLKSNKNQSLVYF